MTNTKPQCDLVVIGELNVDLILGDLNSFPEPGKEKIARYLNVTLGSSSAIFASNIARLDTTVCFIGLLGNDHFGQLVDQDLKSHGIDTSLISYSSEHQTGITVILRHPVERAMVTFPGAMEYLDFASLPKGWAEKGPHLHISSIFLQPGIKRDLIKIVSHAKKHGMTISIDPQWDPDERWDLNLTNLFKYIDFFLPNEAEFLNLASANTVEEGFETLKTITSNTNIIVKRGAEGVTYFDGEKTETIPTFTNPDPVDTIGAGDSFNAGFIYQFLKGADLSESIRFGNLTGAVSTTSSGGTTAIKSFEHVLDAAKNKLEIKDLDDFTTKI